MADSIRPWICAYLIDIGETYGGNYSAAPYWEKKKKVQLVEFLTFPNSADDTCPIYAKVSDKLHKIPVQFTPDAIEAYSKKNSGRRFTEHRNAIVQIKNFHPKFSRVPIGNNVRTLSPDSHLVFEVGSIEILGSENEGEFGNPKDVEENAKVMAWTEGLREHGGGGNVLKLRKEAQGSGEVKTSPTRASRLPAGKVAPSISSRTPQVAKKRAESGNKATPTSPPKPGVSVVKHPLDLYKRQFRCVSKDSELFRIAFRPQEVKDQHHTLTFDKDLPVASTSRAASKEPTAPAQPPPRRRSPPRRHALDLDSSQPQMASPERKQSVPPMPTTPTPSEWPASRPSSRHRQDVPKMDVDLEHDNELEPVGVLISQGMAASDDRQPTSPSKPSSHLSAPTPAQRPKSLSPSAPSSPVKVIPSSVPRSSIETPSRPPSSPQSSLPIHMRRRVPYPTPPVPPDPEVSGFGRILVPNSDTSGQSQSQSQSQAHSEQHHASQVIPRARNIDYLPARDPTDDPFHLPLSQQPVRPSQPDSYDGDRSSPPELLLQSEKDKQRQHILDDFGVAYEASKVQSFPQRSQTNKDLQPEVVERDALQEDDEEEIDQLQSDGELSNTEGDRVDQPPERDISDDDAQIHAMLIRDEPQNGELQKTPDPAEVPARISPAPQLSDRDNEKRHDSSTTIISQSPPAAVSNGSRKRSRAASLARSLSPIPPPVPQPSSNNIKISKDGKGTLPPSRTAVEHDAEAWKHPSFMKSVKKGKAKAEPTVHSTVNASGRDKAESPLVASSSKTPKPVNGSLHESDAGASKKATSTKDQINRANTPAVVAGPSRPNKRVRDHLSESSSLPSSAVRGDSGSGSKSKKRKIEVGESGNRAGSTSSARSGAVSAGVRMVGVKDEPVRHQPRISSDAPTDSGSGNRKKRRIDVEESGSGVSGLVSTSAGNVRISDSRREKQNGEPPPLLDDEPLLKGFTFDFLHLPPDSGGPRLRTWRDIQATLLAIGREMTPKVPR